MLSIIPYKHEKNLEAQEILEIFFFGQGEQKVGATSAGSSSKARSPTKAKKESRADARHSDATNI